MDFQLNENDKKLLEFCKGNPKTARQIAEHLGIARKNVFVKVEKLRKLNYITVRKSGAVKKLVVKTKEDEKTKKYHLDILKQLEKSGGEMKLNDFHKLNPFDPFDEKEGYDKFHSVLTIQYSPYVEHIIRLSKKGKQFLKENEKKKN